ncbi:MAG: VIT1/CCC1 transporter family protein [bacterium]|nr:VIT1/CCC1 transporter family protein [bacterium]MDZ4231905.1 VIT1/CCC1 transporter family protein [Candidatus Pacearchaeota archaeon]
MIRDLFLSEETRKERYGELARAGKAKEASENLHRLNRGTYVPDFVYGANDGIVTTFAVVAGATGALFSPAVIIILGIANLVADGFSMGASSFLSLKSARGFVNAQKTKEEWEVQEYPEIEIKETEFLLGEIGVPSSAASEVAQGIAADKQRWVKFLVREKLGLKDGEDHGSPLRHGMATFAAFLTVGFIPLLPYLLGTGDHDQFLISVFLSGLAFFLVGAARTLVTDESAWKGGLEILLVGGLAASVAYGLGWLIRSLFGIVL